MASFCPNFRCVDRSQPDTAAQCGACGTGLVIGEKYRLTKSVRTSPTKASDTNPAFCWTELFRAHSSDRKFLIKILVIKPEYLSDPGSKDAIAKSQQRFQREFDLLQRGFSGVCQGYDFLQIPLTNGLVTMQAIVMEYIDGLNLDQYVQRYGAIDSAQALRWLQQLTDTLAHLHAQQVQHRDIKPSNIMVAGRGLSERLVLIDLGIALDRSRMSDVNDETEVLGTLRFTDPAYWDADNPQPFRNDFDLYSLGITFVYLLTGESIDHNWLSKIGDPAPDPKLITTIQRMIITAADQRSQRFASTEQLLKYLIVTAEPLAKRQIPKWLKLLALVLMGLFATLWLVFWKNQSENLPPQSQRLEQYVHEICELDKINCGSNSPPVEPPISVLPRLSADLSNGAADKRQAAVENYQKVLDKYKQESKDKKAIGELLIYLNNARVQANYQKFQEVFTLVVAVPNYAKPHGVRSNVLTGVAQAQKKFNETNQQIQLYVAILQEPDGDYEDNKKNKALVKELIKKIHVIDKDGSGIQEKSPASSLGSKFVGVVGHYSSQITFDLLPHYAQDKILLISPSATRADIPNKDVSAENLKYFGRVISNGNSQAYEIATHLKQLANNNKNCGLLDLDMLYQQDDTYSNSLNVELKDLFFLSNDDPDQGLPMVNAAGNIRVQSIAYKQGIQDANSLIDKLIPKLSAKFQESILPANSVCKPRQAVVFFPGADVKGDQSKFIKAVADRISSQPDVLLVGNITVGDILSNPEVQSAIEHNSIYDRTFIVAPYNILNFLPTPFVPNPAWIKQGFVQDLLADNEVSADLLAINWRQIAGADATRVFTKAIELYHQNPAKYANKTTTEAIRDIVKDPGFAASGIFSPIKFHDFERAGANTATILRYIPSSAKNLIDPKKNLMVAVPSGYRDPRSHKEATEYRSITINDLGSSQ
jgi:serine/threonine protein kinase